MVALAEGDTFRRQQAQQKLEREIAPLQTEIQRALSEVQRTELFSSTPAMTTSSGDTMESIIQSSDDMLRESRMLLSDTEHIGNQTLQQMGQQREQLLAGNRNVAAIQETAQRAKSILSEMSRRVCRSKLALYVMIALLLFANVYVLFHNLFGGKSHEDEPSDPDDDQI